METRAIFSLLKHLTCQTNTTGLTTSLLDIISANFSGVQVTVYELQSTRKDHSKDNTLTCIDSLRLSDSIELEDSPNLYEAYATKAIVESTTANNKPVIILPVELYDKTVSHLIRVVHPFKEANPVSLLMGLLEIFTDVFRILHEKGYDPLTRILNRQAFDQVSSQLAYANKLPEHNGQYDNHNYNTIAILDIDKFKAINDQFGHAIGDETLVLFAQTARSVLRQGDLFFRYGGEEFVVFIQDSDREQAIQILERCRQAVEERRFPQVGQVTISIGIADLDHNSHPVESLSKADKALYYIKNNGRNQVRAYEDLIDSNLMEPVEPIGGSIDFWDD